MKNFNVRAFVLGVQGFERGLNSAPHSNEDLMKWVIEDYNSWDDKIMKEKIHIYKSYILGWTTANLN